MSNGFALILVPFAHALMLLICVYKLPLAIPTKTLRSTHQFLHESNPVADFEQLRVLY
ncbi:hypothetical protein IQ277_02365 [Nostocales cyanobacterium LEGE 12452]|nr:hypothetical protein [Nostocales cyanobacterium LEGE 12452]